MVSTSSLSGSTGAAAERGHVAHRVGVMRLALSGAIASGIFFLLCWLGAFLPVGPASHLYLQLFTSADPTTGLALAEGLSWSLVFGLVAGGLIALSYNLLARLDAG
jgi:hypothetical protein